MKTTTSFPNEFVFIRTVHIPKEGIEELKGSQVSIQPRFFYKISFHKYKLCQKWVLWAEAFTPYFTDMPIQKCEEKYTSLKQEIFLHSNSCHFKETVLLLVLRSGGNGKSVSFDDVVIHTHCMMMMVRGLLWKIPIDIKSTKTANMCPSFRIETEKFFFCLTEATI